MMKKITFLFLLFIVFTKLSVAQGVKVAADIDSNKIQIGDQILVKFQLLRGEKDKVQWPFFPDTLGKIEIVRGLVRDTLPQQDGSIIERGSIRITVFDTGLHKVPPFKFTLVNGDSLLTQALDLEAFAPKVDTTQAIKDVKDPLKIPYTFKELAPYIGGGLLLIGLVIWLIYYIRKRRNSKPLFAPRVPDRPAHEVALEMLQNLESEKLWQQGKVKAYHSDLTDIVRSYIEQRFSIPALEQTSEETITSFRSIDVSEELKLKLAQMLRLSDMVKFAKAQPIGPENELSLSNAYEFVKTTIEKTENVSSLKENEISE